MRGRLARHRRAQPRITRTQPRRRMSGAKLLVLGGADSLCKGVEGSGEARRKEDTRLALAAVPLGTQRAQEWAWSRGAVPALEGAREDERLHRARRTHVEKPPLLPEDRRRARRARRRVAFAYAAMEGE